jgi:hypothetical protein
MSHLPEAETTKTPDAPARKKGRKRKAALYFSEFVLGVVVLVVILAVVAMLGRSVDLPDWVVEKVETRMNARLAGERIDLGGIAVGLRDGAYRPTIDLLDVSLISSGDATVLELPRLRTKLDTSELLLGRVAPETLELSGTELLLERDEAGQIVFALGGELSDGMQRMGSFSDALAQIDTFFEASMLRELEEITATGLSLQLTDRRNGEVIAVRDGTLKLTNRPGSLTMNVNFDLDVAGAEPAALFFSADKAKGARGGRLVAKFSNLNTRVLAGQVGALTLLEILDAPVAGALTTEIDEEGRVASLAGTLDISAGVLRPAEQAKPLSFNSARTYVRYDKATERVYLDELSLDAPELRLRAVGHTDLLDFEAGVPQAILGQIRLTDVKLDPEGIFENPVSFAKGALDLRYKTEDLRMDVGQLVLTDQGATIVAQGHVEVGEQGWEAALDANIGSITQDRLLALWPVSAVDKTRGWLTSNIRAGQLKNAAAALRLEPGAPLNSSVTFDFEDAEVRYMKTLPVIQGGRGYVSILKNQFVLALHDGKVTAPKGGDLSAAGSVMKIEDVSKAPALADIEIKARGPLRAALSLLDEEPFQFLSKSDLGTDIATGRAEISAQLTLPLIEKMELDDIGYQVRANLLDLRSEKLVEGRALSSDLMRLRAGGGELSIAGKSEIDGVPLDITWARPIGPESGTASKVSGQIELSPRMLQAFNINLPDGSVTGQGWADIDIALEKGVAPDATIRSNLEGVGLKIAALDWSKPQGTTGDLRARIRLGERPEVNSITLSAAGLDATGSVSIKSEGGLDRAIFAPLKVGNRLNSRVEVVGRGAGQQVQILIRGGTIDIRKFGVTDGGGSGRGSGPPLDLALDRLIITDGISLSKFKGQFKNERGLDGVFQGNVNGQVGVNGVVVPTANGPAFRITSKNGGAVLKASGILKTANGGAMTLTMQPNGKPGQLDGTLKITNARVKKAPALADLLSALSVIGLLEQLSGDGILFGQTEANFLLTPKGVRLKSSSAVGPSMGITMEGIYNTEQGRLDMQGVVSPIYAVNGIFGAIFSPRKGEGLLGFNYKLRGDVAQPKVQVNPLSIFTPGIFREIFRQPPPRLSQ